MVTQELWPGNKLELGCCQEFPLEGSPRGGVESSRILLAKEGDPVIVARHCRPDVHFIAFLFAEGPSEHRSGPPFYIQRCCLRKPADGQRP